MPRTTRLVQDLALRAIIITIITTNTRPSITITHARVKDVHNYSSHTAVLDFLPVNGQWSPAAAGGPASQPVVGLLGLPASLLRSSCASLLIPSAACELRNANSGAGARAGGGGAAAARALRAYAYAYGDSRAPSSRPLPPSPFPQVAPFPVPPSRYTVRVTRACSWAPVLLRLRLLFIIRVYYPCVRVYGCTYCSAACEREQTRRVIDELRVTSYELRVSVA